MKIITLLARLLLALIFVTFGLNGFLHFIPMPPPTGLAAQYFGALYLSHYLAAIFALQLVGGALVLVPRLIALGLAVLAPVVVNILLFHVFMAPTGLPLAFVTAILWAITFVSVREAFSGLWRNAPPPAS